MYHRIQFHGMFWFYMYPFPGFLSPVTLSFLMHASQVQGSVSLFRYAFMLNYGRDLLLLQLLFDSIRLPAIFYKISPVIGFQTAHRSLQTGMWAFKTRSPANKKDFVALYVKFSWQLIRCIQSIQLMISKYPCRFKCITFWYFVWVKIHGTN